MYGNNDYRDYLAHYGIKGMKWHKHKKTTDFSVEDNRERAKNRVFYKVTHNSYHPGDAITKVRQHRAAASLADRARLTAENSRDYHRNEVRKTDDYITQKNHLKKASEQDDVATRQRRKRDNEDRRADKLYDSVKRRGRKNNKKISLIKDAYGGNTTRNKLKRRYKKSGHLSSIPRKKVSTYDVRIFK